MIVWIVRYFGRNDVSEWIEIHLKIKRTPGTIDSFDDILVLYVIDGWLENCQLMLNEWAYKWQQNVLIKWNRLENVAYSNGYERIWHCKKQINTLVLLKWFLTQTKDCLINGCVDVNLG